MFDDMTSSEKFDALTDILKALNTELVPLLCERFYPCEVWLRTITDTFEETQILSEEEFCLEKVVYSPTTENIRYLMRPRSGELRSVLVCSSDLVDGFPELSEEVAVFINGRFGHIFGGKIHKYPAMFADAVEDMARERGAFKVAFSQIGYEAATQGTKVITEKKQNSREDFYNANPLYGLL